MSLQQKENPTNGLNKPNAGLLCVVADSGFEPTTLVQYKHSLKPMTRRQAMLIFL